MTTAIAPPAAATAVLPSSDTYAISDSATQPYWATTGSATWARIAPTIAAAPSAETTAEASDSEPTAVFNSAATPMVAND